MDYIAAYALVILSGNSDPSPSDIVKVLTAAGIKFDLYEIDLLV